MDEFLSRHAAMPMPVVLVATGHRPPRLGLDYTPTSNERLTRFARQWLEKFPVAGFAVVEVVSGLAQGWDQAVAHAAIQLGMPLVAAIPFEGQEARWPEPARRRYEAIRRRATHEHVVCPGKYSPRAFILRDRWMVDLAVQRMNDGGEALAVVLACFDGQDEGGTAATVSYARRRGAEIVNTWPSWAKGVSLCGPPHGDDSHAGTPGPRRAAG
jgi:uncharacterized phage-like protein YoqJ